MNKLSSRTPGKVRVAVLFGGQSDEHDVSLRSAQTIIDALDPSRYEIVPIGITREGRWLSDGDPMRQLTAHSPMFAVNEGDAQADTSPPSPVDNDASSLASLSAGIGNEIDIVIPALHGPMGEDGTIQGLLELAGIPYIGSGVLGSAVAMDKAMAKTILAQVGLPQLPWRLIRRKDWENDSETIAAWIADQIGFPCFTKPANMGSSVGVTKVHNADEFAGGMATAGHFDRRIIVERGVNGRELEVSVLGNDEPIASVAGEVIPSNEFYDYNAKYIDDNSDLVIPAELEGETHVVLQSLAIDAFRALDLAGLARVDFFLERNTDRLYINEINTIPGFTSISMYPLLWAASGIPLPDLVDRLIGLALERRAEVQRGRSF